LYDWIAPKSSGSGLGYYKALAIGNEKEKLVEEGDSRKEADEEK
jgi:hypothetical protein